MNCGWVTIAIENSGVMTLSKNVHGISAKMHWKHREEPVYGQCCETIPEAVSSLDEAIAEDAADEMIEAGAV